MQISIYRGGMSAAFCGTKGAQICEGLLVLRKHTTIGIVSWYAEATRSNRRYSFDHEPIHFLHFSTEHDFAPGSEQYAWILADLKAVDRKKTPWLIAGFHRPFYTVHLLSGVGMSA